jgi:hypothetical protein
VSFPAALGRSLAAALAVLVCLGLFVVAPRVIAASATSGQETAVSVESEVAWGSANGCEENIQTNDFGVLTPHASAAAVGFFDASPHASSSTGPNDEHVWVGCVTANTGLASVTAQGLRDMMSAGRALPLSNVNIGVTNAVDGRLDGGLAGCVVSAGQEGSDSCSLPTGGSGDTLLAEASPGTSELDWQYQLSLPANQEVGSYSGGEVIFTATAGLVQGHDAPESLTRPALSANTAQQGVPLGVSSGSWSGSPSSFSYQWEVCRADETSCEVISDATSPSYTPVEGDLGDELRVDVTAIGTAGRSAARSLASDAVLPAAPRNTALPAVSGSAVEEGVPLSGSTGGWTGDPNGFSYQWQFCVTIENVCGDIGGATDHTYTPTAAYVGRYIRVIVAAHNAGGERDAISPVVGPVSPPPPVNVALPVFSGTPIAASGVAISEGSWTDSPTGYDYQWKLCDGNGENCAVISGATSSEYRPAENDVGDTLLVEVTAYNAVGHATASSQVSKPVLPAKPKDTVLPVVTGSALEEGVPLSASTGTWTGAPTSYSYQWEWCELGENPCGSIPGGGGATYTPTSAYLGDYIRVVVTAANGSGSTTVTSRAVGKISPPRPINTSPPVLSMATPIDATSLSVSEGSWANIPTSFAYQWELCNSTGADCSAIAGATSSSYTPVAGNVGDTLVAEVTAINASGSATASTAASNAVLPSKPQNTVLPAVTGSAFEEGVPLSAGTGTWTGSPTSYSYQWEWCELGENPCGSIPGASGSTYTPTSAYLGRYIRVVVTATNGSGSTTVTSRAVGKVLSAVPVNTERPVLSSNAPIDGISLSVSNGSWTNSPTGYSYQWERCNNLGGGCSKISGATSFSYTPTDADVEHTLVAQVTASSGSGTGETSTSAASGLVQKPPANTSAPALSSGSPTAGSALSVTTGTWSGYPDVFTYAYQWLRCTSLGTSCMAISGDSASSYTPAQADGGSTLQALVTATNTAGQATASSVVSGMVAAAPINTLAPELSTEAPSEGTALSVSTGTWGGYPSVSAYTYQWRDCDTHGQSCTPVTGATTSSYTPTASDIGHTLVAVVTATNSIGSTPIATTPTNPVTPSPAPAFAATPTFTTTPAQGTSIGLANLSVSGSPTPTLSYQWRDCTSTSLSSCTNITGATATTYTPTASDQGLYLSALLTATNTAGSATANVTPTAVNATYMQAVEADHPAADWTFNDAVGSSTAADSVGWGALSGGTKTFGVPGPFAGSGTAVELTTGPMTHSGTPLTSPTVFTIETWFKATPGDVAGDYIENIFANQEGWIWLGLAGCTPQYDELPGKCLIFMWQSPSKTLIVQTGYEFTDTNWHYIAMTHGEDGFTHIYVDGVEYGPFNSSPIYFGLTAGTYAGGVPGSFSHYAYYNSELSAKRIAVHWNASKTS